MIFLIIAVARVIYISLYAVDTPYWDQWDSEADLLLKPWRDGTWTPWELFSTHNEHRIAFTRVLSLVLFELNARQWDNLVESYVNVVIAAGALCLLFQGLRKHGSRMAAVVAFVFVGAIGALPFSWENMLVGFQSQFYFLLLLSIAQIYVISFRTVSVRTTVAVTALALAALFTSASGLLAAQAAAFLIVIRGWHDRTLDRRAIAAATALVIVAAIGFHIVPFLPGSVHLQAQGFAGHVDALLTGLAWPLEPTSNTPLPWALRLIVALIIWLPSAWTLLRVANRRDLSPSDWFALGLSAFVFAQLAVMAHSRGYDPLHLASRYMDIPALGLAVNAYLAAQLVGHEGESAVMRRGSSGLLIAFVACVTSAFVYRTPWDLSLARQRAYYTNTETVNVAAYMATNDPSWLDQPPLEIPYPSAARLRQLLDDPTIAAFLPPSIRRPIDLPGARGGFTEVGLPEPWLAPPGRSMLGSYVQAPASSGAKVARYTSHVFAVTRPYLVALEMGRGRKGAVKLALRPEMGQVRPFYSVARSSETIWRRAFARVPNGPFQIEASNESPDRWFAFGSVVESGRLSVGAAVLQDAVRRALPRSATPIVTLATPPPTSTAPPGEISSGGDCSIDLVNGKPLSEQESEISGHTLRLDGWALVSAGNAIENEGVTIALTRPDGSDVYQTAQKTLRPDVNAAFQHPGMGYTGFSVHIDTRSLNGPYTLSILQRSGNRQLACLRPTARVRFVHR